MSNITIPSWTPQSSLLLENVFTGNDYKFYAVVDKKCFSTEVLYLGYPYQQQQR